MGMTTASFSHKYQRKNEIVVRTVYAEGDRVMDQFGDEPATILHICWTAADAVKRVEEHRKAIVNADHGWAIDLDRRRTRGLKRAGAA